VGIVVSPCDHEEKFCEGDVRLDAVSIRAAVWLAAAAAHNSPAIGFS
jgi:hypothetical protein